MFKRKSAPVGALAIALGALVLLVAMTGSATAGALITGKQIKNGSVAGKDLRNGSVTGKDVKDRSLSPDDFSGSLEGPQGPAGPAGPQGPLGPVGPRGADGVTGIEYRTVPMSLPAGALRQWTAECPAGKKVIGGGVSSSDPYYSRVLESAPLNEGRGWLIGLANTTSIQITGYAWAVCATAS